MMMKIMIKIWEIAVLVLQENNVYYSFWSIYNNSWIRYFWRKWIDSIWKFYSKTKKKVDDRIYDISNFLKKVISTVPNIEIILLEDIQLQNSINGSQKYFSNQGNNIITFKALAKLQGVLINVCLDEGVEYSVISPSHWKSIVKIKSKYRRDQKKEAMEFVDSFFGENATEDEADAICIGYAMS